MVPPAGSRWLNTKTQTIYTVMGYCCDADSGKLIRQILYRCEEMPEGEYWFRSIESWNGTNSQGQPRFTPVA